MNYSVVVNRTAVHANFRNNELTIPMAKDSGVWKLTTHPIREARDQTMSDQARDLLDLAVAIYFADKHLPREEREKWTRNISLKISLRDPAAFRAIENELKVCLNVLGADNFEFVVTPLRRRAQIDPPPRFRRRTDIPDYTSMALLSGGQDSVAGSIPLLNGQGTPLFIRVNTQDGISSDGLANQIREAVERPVHLLAQPSTTLRARAGVKLHKESTQRLRSFYFLALAATIGQTHDSHEVFINENGIMAIHLPLDPSRSSSFSTRTAYPLYLHFFQRIARNWLNFRNLEIRNLHVQKTKTVVIREAIAAGHVELVANTISCAHSGTIKQTVSNMDERRDLISGNAQELHCGYCFPCILRRISMYNAGAEGQDVSYTFNPFDLTLHTDAEKYASVQEGSSAVFSLIQFTRLIERSTDIELVVKYGQLAECAAILGLTNAAPLIQLHRDFAAEVRQYILNRAAHLSYLLDDQISARTEQAIRGLVSKEKLEQMLLEIGVQDWNDKFEDQIVKAYEDLRIYMQVALANNRVTVEQLENSFKTMLRDALPTGFEDRETPLNKNDGKDPREQISRGCKTRCWPLTNTRN